jgi:uncharacterized protein (TIGR00255 family)
MTAQNGPMLASMTGFARAATVLPLGTLTWEVKTVNGKGLDVRLRLPPGFDAQEAGYRARIAASLGRGSCQATLALQRQPMPPTIRVDPVLLRSLIETVAAAVPPGAAVGPLTLDGLLAIRGVVEVGDPMEAQPADQDALAQAAALLLERTLQDLRIARHAEGDALARLLSDHLDRIGALTEAAEQAPGRTVEAIRARLERSVAQLTEAVPALDPNRLHQEALLLAARADVREELDRLRIHRLSALDLLKGGGVVGRRLDFLAQELAREANTLCSKSNDAGLTAVGLDLRNQIEQFREQVQNLE